MSLTATKTETLNGVPVDRLRATVAAVKEKPTSARFVFRADNRWLDGGHNRSSVCEFQAGGEPDRSRREPFVLDNDEPDVLLGTDRGANPVEYVLHALAGCLTTSLVYHAAARGIRVQEVESTLEGDLDLRGFLGIDERVRNGYEGIRVTFRIAADASDEQLAELGRLAQSRSPVFDTVTRPVPVTVSVARK
jgi:uncharacterized OsmC-like protein